MEAPGVSTLSLTFADGSIPKFVAGQYITVYFPETKTAEGKAYSISSAPGENMLSLTVKAIGEFSNKLCAMEPENEIAASLPYGYFTNEDDDQDSMLVMLAAQWDLPTVPGPFDNSLDAKRARVRARVLAWLQEHYPHLHGTPKRLEAWPMEALQALVEHLKGVAGAQKRWHSRR